MDRFRIAGQVAAGLVWVLTFTGTATAETRSFPGIIGNDDRQPVERSDGRWRSVGQVNIGGYRRRGICTGTLVAPDVVITAAHCVYDAATREPFRLANIHFVAGVFRNTNAGHATARCLKFPPGFAYEGPEKLLPDLPAQKTAFAFFKTDLAMIVLAEPIDGVTPMTVAHGELPAGTPLLHASYGADRRYILSVQDNCSVLGLLDSVVVNDCDAHFGSSGGPIFTGGPEDPRLAAIQVGVSENGVANFATPLGNWPGLSVDNDCP